MKISPEKTVIKFGDVPVYAHSVGADFDMSELKKVMKESEVLIDIDLGEGEAEATVFSCDFSFQYIKINSDYTT